MRSHSTVEMTILNHSGHNKYHIIIRINFKSSAHRSKNHLLRYGQRFMSDRERKKNINYYRHYFGAAAILMIQWSQRKWKKSHDWLDKNINFNGNAEQTNQMWKYTEIEMNNRRKKKHTTKIEKKENIEFYSIQWVRANQPAGAVIRLQSIIGQSRKVIDNVIDCNLIKKNLNIFVANKNSMTAKNTQMENSKLQTMSTCFFSRARSLSLSREVVSFFVLFSVFFFALELNWPIVRNPFINICKTDKLNESRAQKKTITLSGYTILTVGVFK